MSEPAPAGAPCLGGLPLDLSIAPALLLGAAGVLLLRSLPDLLALSGGLLSLGAGLLGGFLLGLAAVAAVGAAAFFRLTQPGSVAAAAPPLARPRQHPRRLHPLASRAVAAPGPTMPHAIACEGEFSGRIYTVPASQWDRGATVPDWPPWGDPRFSAWEASVAQGTLVLTPALPDPEPQQQGKGQSSGGVGAGAGAPSAPESSTAAGVSVTAVPTPAGPPRGKVGVLLEGCSVELVEDGLEGRSPLIRRAPLLLAHPDWPLLDGEKAFYVFAGDPCSKQQWQVALGWWCVGGERYSTLARLYRAYCLAMADRTMLPYAVDDGAAAAAAEGEAGAVVAAAAGSQGRRVGWKGWGGAKGRRAKAKAASQEQEAAAAAAVEATLPGRPAPAPGAKAGSAAAAPGEPSLESIMEARWMQSSKFPVKQGAAGATGGVGSAPAGGSPPPASHLSHLTRPGPPAYHAGVRPEPAANEREEAVVTAAVGIGTGPEAKAGAAATPAGYPVKAAVGAQEGPGPCTAAAAAPAPAGPGSADLGPLPPGLPPLLSLDQAVNMFLCRASFDLLRSPIFKGTVIARLQRKLSRMATPDYVQPLEVVGLDLGCTAPSISNLSALPAPDGALWPQIVFDMKYEGSFTIVLETKVEIREAPVWSQLNRALTKIGGHLPGVHGHAAQEQRDAGGEEEEEEEEEEEDYGEEDEGLAKGTRGVTSNADASSPVSPSAGDGASASGENAFSGSGGKGGRRLFMGGLRRKAAKKLRQLAETTATHISRTPLRLSLTFSVLEGRLAAWLPPPPGDRLFFSFLTPPRLELTARPEVGGRLLKYSYHIARASSWVEQHLRRAITSNMVFPGGGDILLAALGGEEHQDTADLPGLSAYLSMMDAAAASAGAKSPAAKAGKPPASVRSVPASPAPVAPSAPAPISQQASPRPPVTVSPGRPPVEAEAAPPRVVATPVEPPVDSAPAVPPLPLVAAAAAAEPAQAPNAQGAGEACPAAQSAAAAPALPLPLPVEAASSSSESSREPEAVEGVMRIRGGESALPEAAAELVAGGGQEGSLQQEAESGFLPSLVTSQLQVASGGSSGSAAQEQRQESGHLISPRASSDLDPGFPLESPRGQMPPREERPTSPGHKAAAPQQPGGPPAAGGKAHLGAALSRGLTWAKQQRQQGSLQEQGRKAASALATRVSSALAEAQARKAARKASAGGAAPEAPDHPTHRTDQMD